MNVWRVELLCDISYSKKGFKRIKNRYFIIQIFKPDLAMQNPLNTKNYDTLI